MIQRHSVYCYHCGVYFQVKATDLDSAQNFGEIVYTINEAESTPSRSIPFTLNRITGELKTDKEIR